jgi:enoyl-CoA hydratase
MVLRGNESLLIEINEGIATVTINRPQVLNALNTATLKELKDAFCSLDEDPEVKVIILTGAGKAFVAGADISEMKPLNAIRGRNFGLLGQSVFTFIENLSKPVIAAVNGFALGGGTELALSCDLIYASEKAKFGQPEVGLGVTPGFGGTQRLPRRVGMAMAKELIYSGKMIRANEAKEIGLANKVVPPEELMGAVMGLAQEIASKGQVSVRMSKAAINRGMDVDINSALAIEADAFGLCFATDDQKEGMAAFVEKRKPEFTGK